MSDRLFQRAAGIASLAAAVICCAALATLAVWRLAPDWIDAVDEEVVERYTKRADRQLRRAVRTLAENPAAGFDALAQWLDDHEAVRKQDRLAVRKGRAFDQLTAALLEAGDHGQALARSESWVAFDPRSLHARLRHIDALFAVPERGDEAVATLAALAAQLPEARDVAHRYADWLFERGEALEAWRVLLEYSSYARTAPSHYTSRPWRIFYSHEKGFAAERSIDVTPEIGARGELRIDFRVPDGFRHLRLDPPAHLPVALARPVLSRGEESPMPLWDRPLRLHEMESREGIWVTWGGDPYVSWWLDEAPRPDEVFALRAVVLPAVDAALRRLVDAPDNPEVESALRSRGAPGAADHLAVLRTRVAGTRRIGLSWRARDQEFAAERSAGGLFASHRTLAPGDGDAFELAQEIGEPVAELRVELPDVVGARFSIDAVEVEAGGRVQRLTAAQLAPRPSDGVRLDAGAFEVTDAEPSVRLTLPAGDATIDRVVVFGSEPGRG